ncbi:AMP-binding protein [bacterium]|nr:AMP-binding protein [bacterium]
MAGVIADTIPALFRAAAAKRSAEPFLQYRKGEEIFRLTYGDVLTKIEGRARSLLHAGLQKNDRIALLGENSSDWVIAYLAILQAGCIVVPIDSLMPLAEILHVLELSDASLVLCSERFVTQLQEIQDKQKHLVRVECFTQVTGAEDDANLEDVPFDRRPTDVAAVIFTSGTTGHSKGVVLTHENLISNVLACCEVCEIEAEDNFLLLLPLHHTFASTVTMLLPIAKGARATLATSFRSRDVIDDIRICGVSVLVGVPQLFENIKIGILRAVDSSSTMKQTLFYALMWISQCIRPLGLNPGRTLFKSLRVKAGLSSVRLMVSGGAALPVVVNKFFESLGFVLVQGYGLTETSPVLCVNPPARNKIGSVGPALRGVTLRIKDPNQAGIGEVCARGPNIMQGYYENPDATSRVLQEGWLHTGDAGYLDRDGYLYLTGRLKNVIVTSAGKNVYPEEIEAKLMAEEAISDALVLAVERKGGRGEKLCALIKLDDEYVQLHSSQKSPEEIATEVIRRYNSSSPAYQNIREWRLLEGEFEKTSTRKIKRFLYSDYFH